MDRVSHDVDECSGIIVLDRAESLLRAGDSAAALALLDEWRPRCTPDESPYAAWLMGWALLDLGRRGEAYTVVQAALADPAIDADDAAHVHLLGVLGNLHHADGHFQAAAEAFGRALHYAERHQPPDHAVRARLLVNLGSSALKSGQVEAATIYYERAVDAARLAGDARRLGMAHMGLGFARQEARDLAAALAHAQEAVRLFEQAGEPRLAIQARTNLALAHVEQDEWDAATPHLRQVLAQARADGDLTAAAHALELLARASAARNDDEEAARLAVEAREMAERGGDDLEAHLAAVTEAVALVALGRAAEAEALYRRAIDYFRAAGASRHLMSAGHGYATALRAWGRDDEALEVLDGAYAVIMNLRQG